MQVSFKQSVSPSISYRKNVLPREQSTSVKIYQKNNEFEQDKDRSRFQSALKALKGMIFSKTPQVYAGEIPNDLNSKKRFIAKIIKEQRLDFTQKRRIRRETLIQDANGNFDTERSTYFQNIKIEKQADLIVKLLTKKDNDKFLYDVTESFAFAESCPDDETIELAMELVEKAGVMVRRDALNKFKAIKEQDIEKYNEVLNSKYLTAYVNRREPDDIINVTTKELLEIESEAKKLVERYKKSETFDILIDLYINNPEAYRYIRDNKVLFKHFFANANLQIADVNFLDVNALHEIKKAYDQKTGDNSLIRDYVYSSDAFKQKDELDDYISQFKTDAPITVYRSERNTNIFNSVSLKGTELEVQTKAIIENNKETLKNDETIIPNEGTFMHYEERRQSLYDYLMDKEELSLAEAMLLAKYGDEDYINNITEMIQNTELYDDRFKSTSFSKAFVDKWKNSYNSCTWTNIMSELSIKEGTEGVYDAIPGVQIEFILNRTPKRFQYHDVSYDRKHNTFFLKGTVENVKED